MHKRMLILVLLLAQPALIKPATAKPATAKPAAAKHAAGKTATGQPATTQAKAGPPTAASATAEALSLRKLVDGLRTAIQASQAAHQDPDLAAVLLDTLAESALTGVIHGHYALAGCGQALRTGGLGADDTRAYAQDMAQNWQHLAQAYTRLATQKAFDPALRNIFQSLAMTTEKAATTAQLLAKWAELADDNGRAAAFTDALEDYRGRVKAFVAFVQGEPGK